MGNRGRLRAQHCIYSYLSMGDVYPVVHPFEVRGYRDPFSVVRIDEDRWPAAYFIVTSNSWKFSHEPKS